MAIPLRIENLDCTIFENDRNQAYVTIGEHFVGRENDWRAGQRSFSVNISDPDGRKALVLFLNHVGATVKAALETYPAQAARSVPSTTRASWVKDLDRTNGPVKTVTPARTPTADKDATGLLDALKGR